MIASLSECKKLQFVFSPLGFSSSYVLVITIMLRDSPILRNALKNAENKEKHPKVDVYHLSLPSLVGEPQTP